MYRFAFLQIVIVAAFVLTAHGGSIVRRPPASQHRAPLRSQKDLESMRAASASTCPCSNAALCQPLQSPKPAQELFVYTPDEAMYTTSYNWSKVTSVVTYELPHPEFVCYAHERGVRVIFAFSTGWSSANTASTRDAYAESIASVVALNGLDGINMDFEEHFANPMNSSVITALYFNVVDRIKANNSNAQTSVCIGTFYWWALPAPETWYPYDFAALLSKSDFLMAMMYDMSTSQVGANSYAIAISATLNGLDQVASMAPNKLVLGFPWYGYQYTCSSGSTFSDCVVETETEVCFDQIVRIVYNQEAGFSNPTTVVRNLDVATGTYAWFSATYTDNSGSTSTMLFVYDDVQTLNVKYQTAMSNKVKGLSMWQASCLGNSTVSPMPEYRAGMWEAIQSFF